MSIRNLDALLNPRSVAVIGASTRARSIGEIVLRNLIAAGFSGPLYPVNPKYERVLGIDAYASIDRLPAAPEMAVVCTPPATVPGISVQSR